MWLATVGLAPPGLAQLDRFVGTWQSSGTFVDSAYSKAGSATATTSCTWSSDRLFLICQQNVTMNGKPADDIAIYTYDDTTGKYHFYNVSPGNANSTKLAVDDSSVTYTDSFTDGAKNVLTRTLNVWQSPQRYTWRSEYSLDAGKTWVLMGSGASTLVQ